MHTPNGYDPRWLKPINDALADRGATARVTDLTDSMWANHFGPLLDAIEDGEYTEVTQSIVTPTGDRS